MKIQTSRTYKVAQTAAISALVWLAAAAVPPQVRADDTEVFFPTDDVQTQGTINPNILFIIDDSGSMSNTDGTGLTRLKRVQDAFKTIMDEMRSNTNVGLMRFSYQAGGPVIFPVTAIETAIKDVHPSFATIDQTSRIVSGANNEVIKVGSNSQVLNPGALTLGYDSIIESVVAENALQPCSSTACTAAGTFSTSPSTLALVRNASNSRPGWIGLRFTNLPLPSDFVTQDARLLFTASGDNANKPNLRIFGHKFNNSPALTTGANNNSGNGPNPNNLSNVLGVNVNPGTTNVNSTNCNTAGSGSQLPARCYNPAVAVSWSAPEVDDAQEFVSPDVKGILDDIKLCSARQSAANLGNACTGSWTNGSNALTFLIGGALTANNGPIVARSISGASDNHAKPRLQVAYKSASSSTTTGGPQTKVITGLRFTNVQIPTGVTVTNASINFNQDGIGGFGNLKLKISVEDSDNAADFNATQITSRTYNSTTASWTVPQWSTPLGLQSTTASTPGLKDLLQKVVNRPGWCAGQSVSFKIEVDTGSDISAVRRAFASGTNGDLAPSLSYSYSSSDPALETGCSSNQTTSVQITAGEDDAEERPIGGTPTLTEANLELGCNGTCNTSNSQIVGLRFSAVNIPVGATVTSARVEFKPISNSAGSGAASFTFYGQNSGDSPALEGSAAFLKKIRDNERVAPTVVWNSGSGLNDWTSTSTRNSPELKTIVQAIVNRGDWAYGHAMTFVIDGSGTRKAFAREGSSSGAPKLVVSYKAPAGKLTVRNYLKLVVDQLTPYSYTPTVGTYYEGARYMRGDDAFYGRTRGFGDTIPATPSSSILAAAPNLSVSHPSTMVGTPNRVLPSGCSLGNLTAAECAQEKYTGATTYKSPITDSCQSNNIVLLTDGFPNYNDAISKVKTLIGSSSCQSITLDTSQSYFTDGGTCAAELAEFLYKSDQIPDSVATGSTKTPVPGVQKIRTYTIGFSFPAAAAWLTDVATKGGGTYNEAASSAELADVFREIVADILDVDTTFVAPAVTINTFNRLTHRNELYFALFKPNSGTRWDGNVKRYKLDQKVGDAEPKIYGANDKVAVEPATGFFNDEAKSFWSTIVDGADVASGGSASQLETDIKLYTYIGNPTNTALKSVKVDENTSTTTISQAMLGITGSAQDINSDPAVERVEVLKWARGLDVLDQNSNSDKTDARKLMVDPLHSEPVLISYVADKNTADSNKDDPLIGIYFGSNDGIFHGINADDGKHNFSFIPDSFLPNLYAYYEDDVLHDARVYGIDGPITSYVNDGDLDGNLITAPSNHTPDKYSVSGAVTGQRNDFAHLYVGTRRGVTPAGSKRGSYYAFDVTNRVDPTIKFKITGGAGEYGELGQTWSRMRPIAVRVNGKTYPDDLVKTKAQAVQTKHALLFAGGYDPIQDSKSSLYSSTGAANSDSQGRAIYVMDADTGAVLWSADASGSNTATHLKIPEMQFSIVSSPLAVDLDTDGYIDRIYFADLGGQIFRIILGKDGDGEETLSGSSYTVVATLASFDPNPSNSAQDTGKNARRFFSAPDVALIQSGDRSFLTLAIGSGHRENPLSTGTEDRFYILHDPDIANDNLKTGYFPITESSLVDVTTNINSKEIAKEFSGSSPKKGLYIRLVNSKGEMTGEKALTEATTFNNQVIFATYEPTPPDVVTDGSCKATQGTSRFYQINVADGTPVQDFNEISGEGDDLTKDDRSKELNQAGLPPDPVLIFPSISVQKEKGSDGVDNDGDGQTDEADEQICNGPNCISSNPLVFIGAESVPVNSPRRIHKTYWQKIEQ